MLRRLLTILFLLLFLAGCEGPQPVIKTLPSPVVPSVSRPKVPIRPDILTRPKPSLRGKVIVVDPGHGGKMPGAWKQTRSKLPEKTINLDIAQKVAASLSARGAKVIQTRTSDVHVENINRARLAERSRADLFVSIHANSSPKAHITGTSVHIYNKASKQSQWAAHYMVSAFKGAGIDCRGIYRNNFEVLREHSRPAILIECGFLTNSSEAQKLNTSTYRTRMADTIVEGIANYFSRYGS